MLVDNEISEIERMYDLVNWNEHGYHVAAKITRSIQVIDSLIEHEPNLIFIELVMPVIDGLELCRRIRKIDSNVKIIILTSNTNFQFAKEAMNIGVDGYIEKRNLNKSTIVKHLDRLRDDINKIKEVQNIIKKYGINEIIKKHAIGEIFNTNLIGEIQLFQKSVVMIVKLDSSYNFWYNILEEHNMPIIDSFPWDKLESFSGIKLLSALETNDNMWTIVMGIKDKQNNYQIEMAMNQLTSLLQTWFRNNINNTVSIAYLTTEHGLNDLPNLYDIAVELLKYSIFLQNEVVINSEKTLERISKKTVHIREFISKIHDAVINEDRDELIANIDAIFQKAVEPYWNLTALRKICIRLVHVIDYFRVDYGVRTLDETLYEDKSIFSNLFSIESVKDFFISEYDKLLAIVKERKSITYSLKVDQCIHYLYKNYNTSISIKDASEHVGINHVYLGQLFKKEVGCTFSEYLTKYRVKNAKIMLKNEKYKIYEIAKMVGFNSSQYFSKVFYKETDQYPTEFRVQAICHSRRRIQRIQK